MLKKNIFISFLLVLIGSIIIPSNLFAQEKKDEPIITVSNITASSFTVSWFSREERASVFYGKSDALITKADDERGNDLRRTHHVTLKNLEPDTEYLFKIGDNGPLKYRQKTAKRITGIPPLPERFLGKVETEDGTHPSESIVYMKIEGAQLLSAITDPTGNWEIKTTSVKSADLSKYFKLQETNYVDFFARSGIEGEGAKKIFAYGREYPIEIKLQESLIPFFKISLPDQAQFRPTEITPISTTQPSASPGSQPGIQPASESFFSVIWRRVSEIF